MIFYVLETSRSGGEARLWATLEAPDKDTALALYQVGYEQTNRADPERLYVLFNPPDA